MAGAGLLLAPIASFAHLRLAPPVCRRHVRVARAIIAHGAANFRGPVGANWPPCNLHNDGEEGAIASSVFVPFRELADGVGICSQTEEMGKEGMEVCAIGRKRPSFYFSN